MGLTSKHFGNIFPIRMSPELRAPLADAIRRALRPLVRILLRNGVAFGEFSDYAKQAYIDSASSDLRVPGRKPTTSRISLDCLMKPVFGSVASMLASMSCRLGSCNHMQSHPRDRELLCEKHGRCATAPVSCQGRKRDGISRA